MAGRIRVRAALALLMLCVAAPALAHPVPFSFVDLRIRASAIEVSVVAHAYDVCNDVGLDVTQPERLMDAAVLDKYAQAIATLISSRMTLTADGRTLTSGRWSAPEAIPDRLSVRLSTEYPLTESFGMSPSR